jgi:hypothetical protein
MIQLAMLFGIVALTRVLVEGSTFVSGVLRGALTAGEVRAVGHLTGLILLAQLLLFGALSNELPAGLFIYGRF